jgi:hypothetical protein
MLNRKLLKAIASGETVVTIKELMDLIEFSDKTHMYGFIKILELTGYAEELGERPAEGGGGKPQKVYLLKPAIANLIIKQSKDTQGTE